MKIKTSELFGTALDWAVAEAQGMDYFYPDIGPAEPAYSTDWSQAGEIIEHHIYRLEDYGDAWEAEGLCGIRCRGATPLVAAMRAYVAVELGSEVEVPDDLAPTRNK